MKLLQFFSGEESNNYGLVKVLIMMHDELSN